MGRQRIPTTIKAAQGTLQKCRSNLNEPVFFLLKTLPDPPDFFNEQARQIYNSTGLDLINQGILSGVGLPQFINYCYFTGAAMELMEMIKGQGYSHYVKGKRVQNANIKTLSIFSSLARQFALEFGLTPVSSSKVSSTNKKSGSKLDQFINE